MEGRCSPPKAEHPFPNKVDMSKFWGTPYSKSFFKAFAVYVVGYGIFSGLSLYFREPDRGPCGFEPASEEDLLKGFELSKARATFSKIGTSASRNSERGMFNAKMRFDDGVEFMPPKAGMMGVRETGL